MPNILKESKTIEFIEKKSRFIGISSHFESITEFETQYRNLKKEHQSANHVAYAYRIYDEPSQLKIKIHDDGEVSGTAGKPIHAHIEGNDLINCAVFVVRYFGGIKLGTGGLVRSYGSAARQAIEASGLKPYFEMITIELECSYANQKQMDYLIGKFSARILERSFDEKIGYKIELEKRTLDEFMESVNAEMLFAKKNQT